MWLTNDDSRIYAEWYKRRRRREREREGSVALPASLTRLSQAEQRRDLRPTSKDIFNMVKIVLDISICFYYCNVLWIVLWTYDALSFLFYEILQDKFLLCLSGAVLSCIPAAAACDCHSNLARHCQKSFVFLYLYGSSTVQLCKCVCMYNVHAYVLDIPHITCFGWADERVRNALSLYA